MSVNVHTAHLFLVQRFSCYSVCWGLSILFEIRLRLFETSSHNVFWENRIYPQLRKQLQIYPCLKQHVQKNYKMFTSSQGLIHDTYLPLRIYQYVEQRRIDWILESIKGRETILETSFVERVIQWSKCKNTPYSLRATTFSRSLHQWLLRGKVDMTLSTIKFFVKFNKKKKLTSSKPEMASK